MKCQFTEALLKNGYTVHVIPVMNKWPRESISHYDVTVKMKNE